VTELFVFHYLHEDGGHLQRGCTYDVIFRWVLNYLPNGAGHLFRNSTFGVYPLKNLKNIDLDPYFILEKNCTNG
jgi:hypothetical protein